MNMTAGQPDDSGRVRWDSLKDRVKKLWESSPEPVKRFPWNEALDNFIQLIADLGLTVIKYVCVPLLVVTSLSETSYCAHQKKLLIVPFPLIIGFSVAKVMGQTALSLSPILKNSMVFVSLVSKTSKDIDAAEAQQEGVENIGPDYVADFTKMK
ncbi:uncharacterized protein LOC111811592 isoform X2 [Cucurbita pepo subsp. pepo]|uniref:uncharacterized protein LOC111811592 isoform X2 n=1 Tax=Cucurbita pepo subsp. pepo TaxID=3664 RepID=UPI000C9D5C2C|nr:uncharacterized protein LOC111811592 isoform X2 [Cucurbita pepo subsp. pepo]